MKNVRRVISGMLILATLYMAFKQGLSMILSDQDMLGMLSQWGISGLIVQMMGSLVIVGALLLLYHKTFKVGNIITLVVIAYIIVSQLLNKDFESALIELPFFIMPLILLYLGHPFSVKEEK